MTYISTVNNIQMDIKYIKLNAVSALGRGLKHSFHLGNQEMVVIGSNLTQLVKFIQNTTEF